MDCTFTSSGFNWPRAFKLVKYSCEHDNIRYSKYLLSQGKVLLVHDMFFHHKQFGMKFVKERNFGWDLDVGSRMTSEVNTHQKSEEFLKRFGAYHIIPELKVRSKEFRKIFCLKKKTCEVLMK
jgi:hypothetical protein